jgi:hypothetical protein
MSSLGVSDGQDRLRDACAGLIPRPRSSPCHLSGPSWCRDELGSAAFSQADADKVAVPSLTWQRTRRLFHLRWQRPGCHRALGVRGAALRCVPRLLRIEGVALHVLRWRGLHVGGTRTRRAAGAAAATPPSPPWPGRPRWPRDYHCGCGAWQAGWWIDGSEGELRTRLERGLDGWVPNWPLVAAKTPSTGRHTGPRKSR